MQPSTFFNLLLASAAFAAPVEREAMTGLTHWLMNSTQAHDVENKVCAPLTVIYARGTNEPGNVGTGVGQSLFRELTNRRQGNIALQGVNFPALPLGDVTKGIRGGQAMKSLETLARKQCPGTQVALAGYSLGGYVVHNALNSGLLPSKSVAAVVTFGDAGQPGRNKFGTVPPTRVRQYCNPGDNVCERGGIPTSVAHHLYASNGDTVKGADFILEMAGFAY